MKNTNTIKYFIISIFCDKFSVEELLQHNIKIIFMISELLKLGLTSEESRVYLATLEIGGGPVTNIAKKAGIHRVSCYHTIEKLEKKKLLSQYIKNKTKYFSAESPETFKTQAQEKVNIATTLIPQLLLLQNTSGFKPKIHFFEGEDGVIKVFEKSLEISDNQEILQFSNLNSFCEQFPKLFQKSFTTKFKKNIKTRILSPNTGDPFLQINTLLNTENKNSSQKFIPELLEVLLVNSDQFFFENEILIFENSVAIASVEKGEMLGLIVESKSFAKSMKAIFNLAWLGATSFVAR
ncbi:TPA: hypothetical protein EYG84_00110 [Candidatus Gracilibacteria bacterium]|nr:hypothetical protein [Candidatus Gracilibacteria bacterium]